MGYTLCVLGCGTMGVAILSGVAASLDPHARALAAGRAKWEAPTPGTRTPANEPDGADDTVPARFVACVSREESARRLRGVFDPLGALGAAIDVRVRENVAAVREADVVLLGCKPQQAHAIFAADGMREALGGKLLVSILAGVTIAQMSDWVDASTTVVRAMPNTPSRIREGMTVVSPVANERDRALVQTIFAAVGRVRFLEEKHFDACTALSGSGPAFACIFLEAMADGGVMMGLPRAEALELAAQTLQGAARMTLQAGTHPAQLKDAVTTPGGCTIAGLLALEDGRVRSTIARAIQIATERASELGQPAKK